MLKMANLCLNRGCLGPPLHAAVELLSERRLWRPALTYPQTVSMGIPQRSGVPAAQ